MVDERLKNLHGSSRRHFLRWTAAAGALLALDRSRVLDVVNDTAGVAMADDAACSTTCRSVHLVAGGGGFAWFQLLWPHVAVATSTNDNFAFHAKGKAVKATETDKPLYWAPETPWQELDRTKRISAFMAGTTQIHTATPTTAATVGNGQSMLAAVAAIQRATPSLLPVIGIEPVAFGAAPGAPQIATVADANGLVELFNSAASKVALKAPEDAAMFEAYYKAFLGLNAAAGRATWARSLRTGKASANLLGKNLASQLVPSDDDKKRYGIDAPGIRSELDELGRALITTVKAFKLGLTQSVIVPVLRDDPHGAFGNPNLLMSTVTGLGAILEAFLADLGAIKDPTCGARSMADSLVLTVHGDTPKDPLTKGGWPDGTPGDSNWLYVLGNGYLKTGWFGGIGADGGVTGFNPKTGADVPGQASDTTSAAAGAAVAYAVAKGDMKRVQDFFSGSIAGIVNENPATP